MALGQRLSSAQREHVVVERAHQVGRDSRGSAGHIGAQPPEHGHWAVAQLALDQVGRGCDLIGHGDDGHLESASELVRSSGVIVEHCDPGRSDGDIGDAHAPRAPHGVSDYHCEFAAEPDIELVHQRMRGRVRIRRQQHDVIGIDIACVNPRRRHDKAVVSLHDARDPAGVALGGHYAHGLVSDGLLAGICPREPTFGLGNDLARDDHDIPGVQPGGAIGPLQGGQSRHQQRGQVVSGLNVRKAWYRHEAEGGHARIRPSVAAAMAAVFCRSDMSSGAAATRIPLAAIWAALSASSSATSQASR